VVPSVPINVTCVALTAVTVSVEVWPAFTEVGLAEICTVGAGLGVTVTVAVVLTVVPPPLAVAVYFVVAEGVTA